MTSHFTVQRGFQYKSSNHNLRRHIAPQKILSIVDSLLNSCYNLVIQWVYATKLQTTCLSRIGISTTVERGIAQPSILNFCTHSLRHTHLIYVSNIWMFMKPSISKYLLMHQHLYLLKLTPWWGIRRRQHIEQNRLHSEFQEWLIGHENTCQTN